MPPANHMAIRTKSFCENQNSNGRTGQRRHHVNHSTVFHELTPNIQPAKPSIPATADAKSKLQSFQYLPKSKADDKENDGVLQLSNEAAKEQAEAISVSKQDRQTILDQCHNPQGAHQDSMIPSLPHANTFPSTPGTRLPLEDLIGSCDESRHLASVEESPEEQIGWNPVGSTTRFTPCRERKRARSSSPTCPVTASQQKSVAILTDKPDRQTDTTTREIDPAADLWQHYAAEKSLGRGLKSSDFSELMFQRSPQPLETPVRSGVFRRWASTGNEWPTSGRKRRRVEPRVAMSRLEDNSVTETGKSKVASMLESIQESFATHKLDIAVPKIQMAAPKEPSSSSPLPLTEVLPLASAISPMQNYRPKTALAEVLSKAKRVQNSEAPVQPSTHDNIMAAELSDKFDSHATTTINDPLISAPLYLHSKAPLPAYKRPSITRTRSYPGDKVPVPVAETTIHPELQDFEDAFDFTADDLDESSPVAPRNATSHDDIHQITPPPCHNALSIDQDGNSCNPGIIIHVEDDDNEDEFGDGDIDDDCFAQAEQRATQALRSHVESCQDQNRSHYGSSPHSDSAAHDTPLHEMHRYVVRTVQELPYTDAKGQTGEEKILIAEDESARKLTAITVRDSWYHTNVEPGNTLHVVYATYSSRVHKPAHTIPGQLFIDDDDKSPFLLVHPDYMLSATSVADSFDCIRKAVLQDRVKATSDSNKALIYGKILHEVFQTALSANAWDAKTLSEIITRTVRNHLEGLWELGMVNMNLATEEITAKMVELSSWANIFVAMQPSDLSLVDTRLGEKVKLSISKLIAIEEHIWSPKFGLKGNVDATVQLTFGEDFEQRARALIAPFEVKTGRPTQSAAHMAQTALYTLLLSDRYDVDVTAGILYYLENSAMTQIAPPIHEIRQMLQQRNRLASYIFRARNPSVESSSGMKPYTQEIEDSGLPDLLRNPFKCSKCYAQQACFTFHALAERGTAESAGMVDDDRKDHSLVWREAVGHLLSRSQLSNPETIRAWFSHWERLLTFEEIDQNKYRREIWTMSSKDRENVGRCFGNLALIKDLTASEEHDSIDGVESSGGKINRFMYVFERVAAASGSSFTEGSQLTVGEPIVISTEQGQWALANGYILDVSRNELTVGVDRKLSKSRQRLSGFDKNNNHAFHGTMTTGSINNVLLDPQTPTLYRVDKDEFSNGLALVRSNLVQLMSTHPIASSLRDLIVHGSPPRFREKGAMAPMPPSQLGEMNEDQQAAVDKVLQAEDFALILGMPGTGKTTTIAHIIRALLAEKKSILLTSFTHTAVDNILLKIKKIAPPGSILRIGVTAKIQRQVQGFCLLAATPRNTIDEIESAYVGSQIVASTCMGINHVLFKRRTFDVCIVDEASQITLPTILGPLLHARKFVLVGDHFQLPPLVQNQTALQGGLDISLFRQLSETHPEAVAALGLQYRMCEDIMTLSNHLIYDGGLQCGNKAVAARKLNVDHPGPLNAFHNRSMSAQGCAGNDSCWLTRLTSPGRKVAFANTDPCGKTARETLTSGKSITNHLEATLTAQIVVAFLALGVPACDIGVITLYRSQLSLIRRVFKKAGIGGQVDIDSADRFQGRDKECIVLSMVRSNENGVVGELLKDWRRVNVALTRARSKLVMVGSRQTLGHNKLLAQLLSLTCDRGWIMNLAKGCEDSHSFNFSSQLNSDEASNSASPRKSGQSPKSASSEALKSPAKSQRSSALQPLSGVQIGTRLGTGEKTGPKVISGKGMKRPNKAQEQVAIEIFEDLTAEEIMDF